MKALIVAPLMFASSLSAQLSLGALCISPSGTWIPIITSATGDPSSGTPQQYKMLGQNGGVWRGLACDASGNLLGVTGPAGPTGPTGATGPQGPAGPSTSVPSGMIAFIKTGACPTGWTEDDTLATFNVLVTTTAAGDVGTSGAQSLTAGAQVFTGTSNQSTSAVSAGTPTGSNTLGAYTPAAIAWPAGVPTFAGSAGTVPAQTFTGSSATTSAVTAGTPAGTNGASATSGNCAATNIAAGTGSTTSCKATAPNLTVTAQVFSGAQLATHTHTLTATGTNGTAAFTPAGTVAWPAGVPTIGAGTFTQPTFTGSLLGTHTHTLTPAGTNGTSAVTGNTAYFKVIACAKN